MKLLYLSGPMTGIRDLNRQSFMDAEHRLRSMGFAVINPHDLPVPEFTPEATAEEIWADYLARDVWVLFSKDNRPDAIVMLMGWKNSRGAQLEAAIARKLNIPVYTYGQVLLGELKNG